MALVSVLLTEILLSVLRNIYTKRRAAVYRHKFPGAGHTGCERGGYLMATAFFRTVILYLLLIAGLRLSGKRQIGELEPIELVLTLLISDLASVPMQDFALPLFNGVIPIITLIALSTLFSAVSLRCVRFRDLVCGQPALVIRDGKLYQETMRRNRLTLDELFEQLRGQGVTDLDDVKYAVLETNGRFSLVEVELKTGRTHQIRAHIINDGRVLTDNLKQAGRDERWLQQELKRQGAAHSRDVFLLSVDEQGAVVCLKKEGAR